MRSGDSCEISLGEKYVHSYELIFHALSVIVTPAGRTVRTPRKMATETSRCRPAAPILEAESQQHACSTTLATVVFVVWVKVRIFFVSGV